VLRAHENGYVVQIYLVQYCSVYDDYYHADENAYAQAFHAHKDVQGCPA
jgi:hypothetical protein|tara:strand:+ start:118 stop:264 length:147 start_codon:yes stop_codon:yes gene_type:complete